MQALRERGPYPILVINGEHGSAKSSATNSIRDLVDPRDAGLRTLPRDERDLMIQASNAWVVAFDNLSYLPRWVPDALCRLSTGGGMGTRELWSDDEEVLFKGRRPLVINGIGEIVTAPDLSDRAVMLTLPRIPEGRRKSEKEFLQEFKAAHAEILGGLLSAVAVGLRNEAKVHVGSLPRMADFAIWATAAESGLGLEPGSFLEAYRENRTGANETTLEAFPFVSYLRELMEGIDAWEGTTSVLLAELEARALERDRKLDSWPKQPNVLSNRLRSLAPNLWADGIEVTFGRSPKRRTVFIRNTREKHRHGPSSTSPSMSPDRDSDGGHCDDGRDGHRVESSSNWVERKNDGDDGFCTSHSNEATENYCVRCERPTPTENVALYTANGGVVCQNCDAL